MRGSTSITWSALATAKRLAHDDPIVVVARIRRIAVLEQIFGKGPAQATQIMLQIHRTGLGVAGVYVLEVAETKVATVHRSAEEHGYPLRSGVEKE